MKIVDIFYSKIKQQPMSNFNNYLKILPKDLVEKNKKYIRWQDRKLNITGKILLLEGLKQYGLDSKYLHELEYTKYERPYLNLNLDFNISHSGEYVLCAIAENIRLGVDIEEIKKIDFNSFSSVFNQNEFNTIINSKNKEKVFYDYWTMKESVVKAIGKGLCIPLKDIEIDQCKVNYDKDIWYLHKLEIDNLYSTHLGTDCSEVKLNYHLVDFYK